MKPEEVKLTLKDEIRVICNFLYYSFPWRFIFVISGSAIAGFLIKIGNISLPIVGEIFAFVIGGIIGLFLSFILFIVIPLLFKDILSRYRPEYEAHRARIQKEALDNVDNHLLK